jgi:hypothetical protein
MPCHTSRLEVPQVVHERVALAPQLRLEGGTLQLQHRFRINDDPIKLIGAPAPQEQSQ